MDEKDKNLLNTEKLNDVSGGYFRLTDKNYNSVDWVSGWYANCPCCDKFAFLQGDGMGLVGCPFCQKVWEG